MLKVVAGIAVNNGKVLLVKARHGIATPGGKLKDGETLKQALCREVLEETGLRVIRVGRFMGVDVQPTYECVVFAMEVEAGTPIAGDDATAVWWGDPSEILSSDIPRDYPWVLDVIYNGVGGAAQTSYQAPTMTIEAEFDSKITADRIAKMFLEEVKAARSKSDDAPVKQMTSKFTPEADPVMNNTQPKWPVLVGQHWKDKAKRKGATASRVVEVIRIEGDVTFIKGASRTTKIKTKELVWRYDLVVEPAKLTGGTHE